MRLRRGISELSGMGAVRVLCKDSCQVEYRHRTHDPPDQPDGAYLTTSHPRESEVLTCSRLGSESALSSSQTVMQMIASLLLCLGLVRELSSHPDHAVE